MSTCRALLAVFTLAPLLALTPAGAASGADHDGRQLGQLASQATEGCLTAPARPGPVTLSPCVPLSPPASLAWRQPTHRIVTSRGLCLTRRDALVFVTRCGRCHQWWTVISARPGAPLVIRGGGKCLATARPPDNPVVMAPCGLPHPGWLWLPAPS